ncbi:MAG: hypothetical protein SVU88_03940, partial [Candidatus Nanohaloarchaea archaeon]|nr:hypothetical protein [Candidatus Nanohaloarchaea archaeon]
MDARQMAAGVVLVAVLAALVGTATAAGDTRRITVGDQETVTATVSNPLEAPDVLHVDFNGDAVTRGLITVELPGDRNQVNCMPAENACEVYLSPGEERDIDFTLTGRDRGEGEFMVEVSSNTTGKR